MKKIILAAVWLFVSSCATKSTDQNDSGTVQDKSAVNSSVETKPVLTQEEDLATKK